MCTILTVTKDKYDDKIKAQVEADTMNGNSDGYCLVLANEFGEIVSNLRSMTLEPILAALEFSEWYRMFLHSRLATGSSDVSITNTHGWGSNQYIYMHNGFIRDRAAKNLDVDSQLIGKWLEGGVDFCVKQMQQEPYANVFLIDTVGPEFYVSRSKDNTLYTDGDGCYSTNKVGPINKKVRKNSDHTHVIGNPEVKPEPTKKDEWETEWSRWDEYREEYAFTDLVDEMNLLSTNFAKGSK